MSKSKKLNEITLPLVEHYLNKHGWSKTDKLNNTFIYKREKEEVYVPSNESINDYLRAIKLLIKDLSFIEKRDEQIIIADILQPKKRYYYNSIKDG